MVNDDRKRRLSYEVQKKNVDMWAIIHRYKGAKKNLPA